MALQVIGTGMGRTGTMSLKVALEQLGFGKCYHMFELFQHPEDITCFQKAERGELVVEQIFSRTIISSRFSSGQKAAEILDVFKLLQKHFQFGN